MVAALSLVTGACSDDEGGNAPDAVGELGIDDGASKGLIKTVKVKSGEAAVIKLDTGARLELPAGALDKDTTIAIKRPNDREAAELVKTVGSRYEIASAPYVLTPHGTQFKKDVSLTLPIAKTGTDRYAVAYLEDEEDTSWEIIDSNPEVSGKSASVRLQHFSVLVLVEVDEGEPEEDSGLDGGAVEPTPAEAGVDSGSAAEDAAQAEAGGDDAGTPPSAIAARFAARLTQCGLVTAPGTYNLDPARLSPIELCDLECELAETCAVQRDLTCYNETSSEAYYDCKMECRGYRFVDCVGVQGLPIRATVCDGALECNDQQDEAGCTTNDYFECGVEQWVPRPARCDGAWNCLDGQDEQNCPSDTHFICSDGYSILKSGRCDGQTNCRNGEDEQGCPSFTCADGEQVVPAAVVCDLKRDCEDGSDEGPSCMQVECDANQTTPDGGTSATDSGAFDAAADASSGSDGGVTFPVGGFVDGGTFSQ